MNAPLRNPLGQFAETPRFIELQRYITDPAFKAEIDAETARQRKLVGIERDRQILANYLPENFDGEPGFVAAARARVAEFEGREE